MNSKRKLKTVSHLFSGFCFQFLCLFLCQSFARGTESLPRSLWSEIGPNVASHPGRWTPSLLQLRTLALGPGDLPGHCCWGGSRGPGYLFIVLDVLKGISSWVLYCAHNFIKYWFQYRTLLRSARECWWPKLWLLKAAEWFYLIETVGFLRNWGLRQVSFMTSCAFHFFITRDHSSRSLVVLSIRWVPGTMINAWCPRCQSAQACEVMPRLVMKTLWFREIK